MLQISKVHALSLSVLLASPISLMYDVLLTLLFVRNYNPRLCLCLKLSALRYCGLWLAFQESGRCTLFGCRLFTLFVLPLLIVLSHCRDPFLWTMSALTSGMSILLKLLLLYMNRKMLKWHTLTCS